MYTSADNGLNWTSSNKGLLATSHVGIISYNNNLFTDSRNSGVLRSQDEGNTFKFVKNGLPAEIGFYTELWNTKNALYMKYDYVLKNKQEFYKSTDNANTWTLMQTPVGLKYPEYYGLSKNQIFIGGTDSTNKSIFYYTDNQGADWFQITTPTDFYITDFIGNGKKLYARGAFSNLPSIYVSLDTGKTWQDDTVGLGDNPSGKLFYDQDSSFYYFDYGNKTIYKREKDKWELKFTQQGQYFLKQIYSYNNVLYLLEDDIYIPQKDVIYYNKNNNTVLTKMNTDLYDGINIENLAFLNDKIFLATSFNGIWKTFSLPAGINTIPNTDFTLNQNYPNPANNKTSINFQIHETGKVQLKIFTLDGKIIKEILDENKIKGDYCVDIDISNMPAGLYIYQLITPNSSMSRKMMVVHF